MRRVLRCCQPLDHTDIAHPGHPHLAVAPGLFGDPFDGVIAIPSLVYEGLPFALGVVSSPAVLDRHHIAPAGVELAVPVVAGGAVVVGRPYEDGGKLALGIREVEIGGEPHPIPHRDHHPKVHPNLVPRLGDYLLCP